jgi:transglutaminase-like putative cysteine protease
MASKFWDWFCAGLVFLLVQLAAVRLRMTGWVPNLEFAETLSGLGVVLGLALGYSRFGRWKAAFLAAAYTLVLLPWHLSTAIELEGDWIERVGSLLGRIWFSVHQLSSRQPVEDVLFFAAVMGALYWALGIFCGFQLSRHASAIGAVLPPGIAIIVIQGYDSYVPARAMTLALFLFLSIVLVGRLHFSAGTSDRRQRRVFETGEASIDIRDQLLLASAIVVAVVWAAPAPLPSVDPAERWWDRATAPMRERLSDAVSALESPYGSGRSGDFFAATARLGRNAVLGDEIVFQARSSIGDADSPPRYYWRAWTYDRYTKGEWSNASAHSQEFTPEEAPIVIPFVTDRIEATFTITMRLSRQTVVYAPAEPVWVNRPGHIRSSSASGDANDVAAWSVDPALAAGDRYQVRSWLSNPTVEDLSLAGTAYPEWITSRYLQVPSDLATRLGSLAAEITAGAESPYEQAAAITTYLRREIEYSATLPAAPNDTDPVAWLLFQSKKGFCTYYASAEVLLLRSLGVPARLATGFAEGKLADGSFTVVRSDAHAWPEVYFPRIGWIEFEPTVSQSALTRPSRLRRADTAPSTCLAGYGHRRRAGGRCLCWGRTPAAGLRGRSTGPGFAHPHGYASPHQFSLVESTRKVLGAPASTAEPGLRQGRCSGTTLALDLGHLGGAGTSRASLPSHQPWPDHSGRAAPHPRYTSPARRSASEDAALRNRGHRHGGRRAAGRPLLPAGWPRGSILARRSEDPPEGCRAVAACGKVALESPL